jgi:small subunit ribosomal protein S1
VKSEETQARSIADLRPKMRLQGTIKETQLYGAVVDIGLEYDGMVHISQVAPQRVNRVSDHVQAGDEVTVWVTRVDPRKGYIGLTMVKPPEVEWRDLAEGQTYTGTVTRMESYGVFVDIGAERPGLLHVREMSSGYVRHPSELVRLGEEIEVRVIKLDRQRKRVDLAIADFEAEVEEEDKAEEEPAMTTMELALQRAQSQEEEEPRRGKPRPVDFSEREDILARTLQEHSRH